VEVSIHISGRQQQKLMSGELVYYFSHHEKLCVVDNRIVAMGGLDACWGRWDTRNHPLADVHPQEFFLSLFPGQGEWSRVLGGVWRYRRLTADYNNSRIMDFQVRGVPEFQEPG
jgi:phospholipase D1/2